MTTSTPSTTPGSTQGSPDQQLPTAADLERIAAEVATEAASVVRTAIGSVAATGTKSSITDVVTRVDVEVEELIRRQLTAALPGSGVIGEELDDVNGSNAISWVVDPIDGTVNFLYDLPVVSVSIAASHEGQVVAGAVADVLRQETFTAASGRGARRDGQPIEVSTQDDLALSLVATGFSYDADLRAEQAATVSRVLPRARDVRCMGSAALNLCWVACGRLEAYYERDLKIYDYAAGTLIAAEAGADVALPTQDGPAGDLLLAVAPGIVGSLGPLIRDEG